MKKHNHKTAKILERGGLMIEALAMLGLISVVTPTMYKKAAERTMEVEDINTASTVRTYANAAEAYINNNYGDLIQDEEWGDGEAKDLPVAQITPYLPYGFNTDRSLYDYGTPNIKIVKNGNNFTAFTLFPIKANADVGQERTARIASLVGSSGGYVYDAGNNARGVGGMWSIPVSTFGANAGGQYSLVTMSSDVMSDSGANMDNDKYLQRTREEGDDAGDELWRNTMRTDLYLGGHFGNETQVLSDGELHSIRNVKSLIINADTANGVENDTKYGLYIGNQDYGELEPTTNNASAYIQGALEALGHQFIIEDDINGDANLKFGTEDGESYNFVVSENGNIVDNGYSGTLFHLFRMLANDAEEGTANTIDIGAGAFKATYTRGDTASRKMLDVSLADDSVFKISEPTGGGTHKISMYNNVLNVYDDDAGYYHVSMFHDLDNAYVANPDNASQALSSSTDDFGIDGDGKDSLGNTIDLTYTNDHPRFGVDIGSNVRVQGVLTAGQVDAQHLRTASFSTGSEHIDDEYKWMDVDSSGVRIRNPSGRGALRPGESSQNDQIGYGTSVMIDAHKVALRAGASGGVDDVILRSEHPTQLIMQDGTIDDETMGDMTMISRNLKVQVGGGIKNNEIVISNRDGDIVTHGNGTKDYRVLMKGGWLDLQDTGFHVSKHNGNKNTVIFSIGQLDGKWENSSNVFPQDASGDNFTDDFSLYATATHGPAIFTDYNPELGSWSAPFEHINYLSIGGYNKDAGVNIIATDKTKDDYIKNVLVIDQRADETSKNFLDVGAGGVQILDEGDSEIDTDIRLSPGTVYIRRGAIEVAPKDDTSNSYLAHEGSGVIRASRFVANNPQWAESSTRLAYEVPDQLYDREYELYNGGEKDDNRTYRYDTYMVNPAYTSVMNDIKLTTRGGARLSDILPDFINKGIYVANNTFGEGMTLRFKGYNKDRTGGNGTFASPYLGDIPAPQCPPGYGKVIAVHPISFDMAQAGGMEIKNGRPRVTPDTMAPGNQSRTAIKDASGNVTGNKIFTDESAVMPHYDQLMVDSDGGSHSVNISNEGIDTSGTISGLNNIPIKTNGGKTAYVLTAESETPAEPLMFQQSTYLKTVVVPLCENYSTEYGRDYCSCETYNEETGECTKLRSNPQYTSGWAALMGFIYPSTYYDTALTNLGTKFVDSNNVSWYWNIFPVSKGSLEAYATVYCYFDRGAMYGGYMDGSIYATNSNVDQYDYLKHNPKHFDPQNISNGPQSKTFRQKLNDPALKYNELW